MSFDLTLDNYLSLCRVILKKQSDCRFITYLKQQDSKNFIILRHDVDRKPGNALRMARIENSLGILSTYYFRNAASSFDAHVIQQISNLGHEIGYHHEALSAARGDIQEANKIFQEGLFRLREICKIETACMHGSPASKYDNKLFWDEYTLESFRLVGEAYLNINSEIDYFTDTGGKWNDVHNVRDRLKNSKMIKIKDTKQLIDYIEHLQINQIYLTTHPERWASRPLESFQYALKDAFLNLIKFLIMSVRKR